MLHLHRFQKSSNHCFFSPFLEINTFHCKCRSIHGDNDHNKDDADDDGADDAGDHNDNHLYNKDDDVSDHNEHDDHLLRDLIILRSGDNQQQQETMMLKTMVVGGGPRHNILYVVFCATMQHVGVLLVLLWNSKVTVWSIIAHDYI